ncbi:MAG: PA domain-containing protein [Bacteroidota bacterium]
MKRINLLKIATLSALGLFASTDAAFAQIPKESIATNLGATRFVITAPTSIVGVKKVTIAPWGAAASPTIFNAAIEKAYDTLAASALLNGTGSYPALTGKFALVFRGGGINFTDKVSKCKLAGAIGVIVVNNVPGDPVGMGAVPSTFTTDIPVLMVSDVDGIAINNVIKSSPAGTAKLTLGTWNTGAVHDLGIVKQYVAMPHGLYIPLSQYSGSTGTVYNKHYTGGAVANYGTATETGVTVTDSVFWTPVSTGVKTYVDKHSYTIASISPADSIKFGFGTPYTLTAPTGLGRYDHQYSIAYSNTDEFPQDNEYTLSQFVNDSIFSKCSIDATTGKIKPNLWVAPVSGTTPAAALIGSMMYVRQADLTNNKYMQYSLLKSGITTIEGATVFTYLLKWTDGVGGTLDSFVEAGELSQVAISARKLEVTDTSGDVLQVKMLNITNPDDPTLKVALDANSWYILMVEAPASYYVGYDVNNSAFTRGYAQFVQGGSIPGSAIAERDESSLFTLDLTTALSTPTNAFVNYPYGATTAFGSNYFVDSIFYDRFNKVPAISLISTPNTLSIFETKKVSNAKLDVYPVPASNTTTVSINLENTAKSVQVKLVDVMGRSVFNEIHENVKSEKFDIDLSKFAPGNYYVVVYTGENLLTKQLTIIK